MDKYIEFEHIVKTFPDPKGRDSCDHWRKWSGKEYAPEYTAWSVSGNIR